MSWNTLSNSFLYTGSDSLCSLFSGKWVAACGAIIGGGMWLQSGSPHGAWKAPARMPILLCHEIGLHMALCPEIRNGWLPVNCLSVNRKAYLQWVDYQQFILNNRFCQQRNTLIMSVFHNVPGVPCVKMERFAGLAVICMPKINSKSLQKRPKCKNLAVIPTQIANHTLVIIFAFAKKAF